MAMLMNQYSALVTLSAELDRSGKWMAWQTADERLHGLATLDAARSLRLTGGSERARGVVSALVEVGCSRGGDDDDAALAVVALLDEGVTALAHQVRDLCELGDVMSTLWERVKAAAPTQGPAAAAFLLKRTKAELVRLHTPGESHGSFTVVPVADLPQRALEELEEPQRELLDLLDWAQNSGVVRPSEVGLILELVATAQRLPAADGTGGRVSPRYGYGAAQLAVAERHGVAQRTVTRRRNQVVQRLREERGRYLADIS